MPQPPVKLHLKPVIHLQDPAGYSESQLILRGYIAAGNGVKGQLDRGYSPEKGREGIC
jgi:hypothetical protein